MRIEEEVSGDVRILRLSGELDATDVPEVAARLDAAASAKPGRVVLNLAGVRFATVGALESLVRAQRRARKRGGKLVVSAPSRFVGRLARSLGLDRAFLAYPRDDEAVKHLSSRDEPARTRSPYPGAAVPLAG